MEAIPELTFEARWLIDYAMLRPISTWMSDYLWNTIQLGVCSSMSTSPVNEQMIV